MSRFDLLTPYITNAADIHATVANNNTSVDNEVVIQYE